MSHACCGVSHTSLLKVSIKHNACFQGHKRVFILSQIWMTPLQEEAMFQCESHDTNFRITE